MSNTRLVSELAPHGGAAKRRKHNHERVQMNHCHCGEKLKTRRGVTRCPVHGQAWSRFYVGEKHWKELVV